MSFNQGSGSGTLSFRPATFNVEWDGVSEAKATFGLECWDTAATYSAVAYPVWESDGVEVCNSNTATEHQYTRGQRHFSLNNSCQKVDAPNVTLPVTASNAVATIRFSAITSYFNAYAWSLTATKGTVTRVVIAGRISQIDQNPYARSSPTVSLISGFTASGCF